MDELKTYKGGCHCGRVRFEVTADLSTVGECNCSICSKKGYVMQFVQAGSFTLLSGREDLADYQFNKKVIHHVFCRHCGVAPFAATGAMDGSEGCAVNVRCIDDVDLSELKIKRYDGKRL